MTNAGSITNFVYSLLPRIIISPTIDRPSGGGGGNAGGEGGGGGAPVGGGGSGGRGNSE